MRSLTWALVAISLVLAAPAAAQEEAAAPDGEAAPTGADAYTTQVQAGIALLVAGDSQGAMAAFRQAMSSEPARPQAIFYLATANRMAGSFQEAITGFERAADNAEDLPRWRARALQAVAETLERMEGQLEPARQAWQAYVRFADAHQAVAFPQIGRARIQAIDVVIEQERAYVEVRRRIAEREARSDD